MKYDYYPTLGPLVSVLKLAADDPVGYLDAANCPYTDEEKSLLRGAGKGGDVVLEEIDIENLDVEQEARRLYRKIMRWGEGLDKGDTSEQATVFRTSTALLDRLLIIASKAADVREVAQWKTRLLQFMEDVLDEDQRIQFEQRLASEVSK